MRVWSDMPRHAQSVDKEQISSTSVNILMIVLIFYIQLSIHENFELIILFLLGVVRHFWS